VHRNLKYKVLTILFEAVTLSQQNQQLAAAKLFEEGLNLLQQVDKNELNGVESSLIGSAMNDYGKIWEERARFHKALSYYQEALHLKRQYLVDYPEQGRPLHQQQEDVIQSCLRVASIHKILGHYDEATAILEEAFALVEAVNNTEMRFRTRADTLQGMAGIHSIKGHQEKALELLTEALDIRQEHEADDLIPIASIHHDIAGVFYEQGDYLTALALYQEALKALQGNRCHNDPLTAAALYGMAKVHKTVDSLSEARSTYSQALDIMEHAYLEHHPDIADCKRGLGDVCLAGGDYDESKRLYEEAMGIRCQVLPPDHPSIADSHRSLGDWYDRQGSIDEATDEYEKAREKYSSKFSGEGGHASTARIMADLGRVKHEQGQLVDAKRLYMSSLEIMQWVLPPDHEEVASVREALAQL